jgi:broad specificity phosphatase PhoE
MRLYVLSRHAESVLNHENRVNGDPAVPAPLTEDGRKEAAQLGLQLRGLAVEACVHTRFGRTLETAQIALEGQSVAGQSVALVEEELLDDVRIGELEGLIVDDYRAWKRQHTRADRFPGGESLDEAAHRYAEGFRRLLALPYQRVLVVCHEIPIRYALNAAGGSEDLDAPVHAIPNAAPFLFDDERLADAAGGIDRLASGVPGTRSPR